MNRHFPRWEKPKVPHCLFHGPMKLMPAEQVPFLSSRISAPKTHKRATRQIYRCQHCPQVAPGPQEIEHGARELSLVYVNPW